MKKLLLLIFVLSSCAPVYVPNIRNSPMLVKAGEFQGSVSFGNGIEAQTALALTNNIGIIGNYSYISRQRFDADNQDDYHRHRLAEGGLGYFSNEEKMFFEVFVGYGTGEGSSFDSYSFFGSQTIQGTGKYERYFVQPAFGFNKKTMHVSFVPRISIVDFSEFTDGSSTLKIDEKANIFWEPAVIGRVNAMNNHLFFIFQGGFSVPVDREPYFDHRAFQFSTGMGFRIGGVRSEQKASNEN